MGCFRYLLISIVGARADRPGLVQAEILVAETLVAATSATTTKASSPTAHSGFSLLSPVRLPRLRPVARVNALRLLTFVVAVQAVETWETTMLDQATMEVSC